MVYLGFKRPLFVNGISHRHTGNITQHRKHNVKRQYAGKHFIQPMAHAKIRLAQYNVCKIAYAKRCCAHHTKLDEFLKPSVLNVFSGDVNQ